MHLRDFFLLNLLRMQARAYRHLYFDLDHTLWDFDTNSIDTLVELFDRFGLEQYFENFEAFHQSYERQNVHLWNLYRLNKINKHELNRERFTRPLLEAGCTNRAMAQEFADAYLAVSPTKTALLPYASEILEYLYPHYKLYIISNGFNEVQYKKLHLSGIHKYFSRIFISDQLGFHKPSRDFFDYVVKSTNARKKECLVIGDSIEADIDGARNAGIDCIFYNSRALAHDLQGIPEINSLIELKAML